MTTVASVSSGASSKGRSGPRSGGHVFYVSMTIVSCLVVLVGFGPTYYFKSIMTSPSLPMLTHVHGAVFTVWLLLFAIQTTLVARHRTDIHRRLGPFGGVLAIAMIVLGLMMAIVRARRGDVGGFADAQTNAAFAFGDMVIFAILVGAALYQRRQPEAHKRLMLLATVSLLIAALGRWPGVGGGLSLAPYAALVLAGPIYDRVALGHIHRAYLWAAPFIIVSVPARIALGSTGIWHSVFNAFTR
jgi:uncharacterized membrane protein YozB (DUF420 family)